MSVPANLRNGWTDFGRAFTDVIKTNLKSIYNKQYLIRQELESRGASSVPISMEVSYH